MAKFLSSVVIVCAALSVQAQEAAVLTAADTSDEVAVESVAEDTAVEAGPDSPEEAAEAAVPGLLVLEAADISLDEYIWTYRPIVIFADAPADPRFREQIKLLQERPEALIERDVIVIIDSDPAARSAVRMKLRPRGFQLTLIGKDGRVNLRKPFPWDVREISRAIDKWPLRQDEIRAGGLGE